MKTIRVIAAGLALCIMALPSQAGIYTDDMTRCLVSNTTTSDKTTLVRWVFSIASLHPEVATTSTLSEEKREALDRGIAALFERLLTRDCRKQTQEAIRYEGTGSLRSSFEVLGQVAMQELTVHPAVAKGFSGFLKYIDEQKMKELAPSR